MPHPVTLETLFLFKKLISKHVQ